MATRVSVFPAALLELGSASQMAPPKSSACGAQPRLVRNHFAGRLQAIDCSSAQPRFAGPVRVISQTSF